MEFQTVKAKRTNDDDYFIHLRKLCSWNKYSRLYRYYHERRYYEIQLIHVMTFYRKRILSLTERPCFVVDNKTTIKYCITIKTTYCMGNAKLAPNNLRIMSLVRWYGMFRKGYQKLRYCTKNATNYSQGLMNRTITR